MDRYEDAESLEKFTRSNKNQDLYENIGKNTRYTNFTDVTNANAFDISNVNKESNTREEYHKMQKYSNIMQTPTVKKELEEFKSLYKTNKNRVYDINSVLAEARKNRPQMDEKDLKRKLKNDKYNILLSLNKEELEEYRKQRKERFIHPDEEELHELIDTIASKTLAGEISKETSVDLLSELMATSMMDKVELPQEDTSNSINIEVKIDKDKESEIEENKDIEEAEVTEEDIDIQTESNKIDVNELNKLNEEMDEKEENNKESLKDADNSFYTGSMELSKQDFDDDDIDDEFKEKKLPWPVKFLFFLIFVGIVAVGIYFVWQM